MLILGTGELARGVQHLQPKHEDLSSDPRCPCKNGMAVRVCDLSAGVSRGRGLLEPCWLPGLDELASSRLSQRPCLKK